MRLPLWGLVVLAVIGVPLLLWLLDVTIDLARALAAGAKANKEANEFISAWEATTFIPISHLTAQERGVVREMLADWRAAREGGDERDAGAYFGAGWAPMDHMSTGLNATS